MGGEENMFWPDKARIAVTTSLMFEGWTAGTCGGALGPIPVAQEGDFSGPARRTVGSIMPPTRAF